MGTLNFVPRTENSLFSRAKPVACCSAGQRLSQLHVCFLWLKVRRDKAPRVPLTRPSPPAHISHWPLATAPDYLDRRPVHTTAHAPRGPAPLAAIAGAIRASRRSCLDAPTAHRETASARPFRSCAPP
eukprot:scaffold66870_cov54-Phaeocystis_antarctica.AAC.5